MSADGWSCGAERSEDRIVSADGSGDVRLLSGRMVRLVDLRIADRDPGGADARAILRTLAGEPVEVMSAGAADRWGRLPAALTVGGPAGYPLAELLVGEGLAVVDPGERDALCRSDLLGTEGGARRRRVGLWKDGGPSIRADDADALRAAAGRFAVVEGRIVGVGERRDRTYLNFGRDWSREFSVVLSKKGWAAAKARGLSAAALTGALVRVRGMVDARPAPTVEVVAPELIEVVEPARVGRAGRAGRARP